MHSFQVTLQVKSKGEKTKFETINFKHKVKTVFLDKIVNNLEMLPVKQGLCTYWHE